MLFILLLFLLQNCTKTPQYIETIKTSDNLFIVQTDTVQPVFTVYRLDSFQTSGASKAIVGEHTDPYFGKTTAKSFCRFKIATNYYGSVGMPSESFDSVALIMHTDKAYYGDTTSPWNVTVHRIRQSFDAPTGTYYNQQQLLTSPEELGNSTFSIRPNVDDSISIRLSDSFGAEIFNLYKRADPAIITQDAFQQFLMGLSVESGIGNQAIYEFDAADTGTYIRVYYHDDQGVHISKTIDFGSEAGNFQFNNLKNDPSGSATESLVAGHDLLSGELGHQFFVNDLAGVGTKFTLPSLKSLPLLEDFVRLESAELDIVPVQQSYRNYPLIEFLGLGVSNENNATLAPIYTADNTAIENGNLNIDDVKGAGTKYQYDITTFSKSEITSTIYTSGTVFLQPFSASNGRLFSLNRLVAGDMSNPQSPSKLLLQMLFFKK